ncbi:hypothetical protein [Nocardia wallacei]|uniref:hypothetical protein n=1 Tax=Nocardia wallacei TaxID=480035 RepID=UPI0024589C78|nr:hypothetical protein [Nocardia wallacei]
MVSPFGGTGGDRIIRIGRPVLPPRFVLAVRTPSADVYAPRDTIFAPLHTVIVPHGPVVTAHSPAVAAHDHALTTLPALVVVRSS